MKGWNLLVHAFSHSLSNCLYMGVGLGYGCCGGDGATAPWSFELLPYQLSTLFWAASEQREKVVKIRPHERESGETGCESLLRKQGVRAHSGVTAPGLDRCQVAEPLSLQGTHSSGPHVPQPARLDGGTSSPIINLWPCF